MKKPRPIRHAVRKSLSVEHARRSGRRPRADAHTQARDLSLAAHDRQIVAWRDHPEVEGVVLDSVRSPAVFEEVQPWPIYRERHAALMHLQQDGRGGVEELGRPGLNNHLRPTRPALTQD